MSEDTKNRTATDVLVSLEGKMDALISAHRSQDLTLKVLANKLGTLIDKIESQQIAPQAQSAVKKSSFNIEAADVSKKIVIEPTQQETIDKFPIGPRRVSRSEAPSDRPEFTDADKSGKIEFVSPEVKETVKKTSPGSVPVVQRVLDKNSKAIFLADVEIYAQDGTMLHKVRTTAAGKWTCSLEPGNYRVLVKKSSSVSREKIEVSQNIVVNRGASHQELDSIVVK
jgi:hypothetical protein